MGTERDYKRFYALLKKIPYADKATLVEQFTHGRTTHLHETSDGEYADMIAAMLKASGEDAGYGCGNAQLRRARSVSLHLMQKLGIDTSDWHRVDAFCEHVRIAGKRFRELSIEEHRALQVKLRMIEKRGGLRPRPKTESTCMIIPLTDNTESN